MIIILSLLFGGMALGLLSSRCRYTLSVDRVISLIVLLLLFTFGLSIGEDRHVLSELPGLGLSAVFISSATILGSLLVSLLISRLPGRKKERRQR
ncbi:LysO family transporter [Xylanibacter caecicola]|uniref:LysO family transporter n=1 Tax=Xylanibacter caecicola TaxID=2736294 RepID=UPI0025864577|nr:LysO family transporter [Xylanibacter caecicola]